MFDAHLIFYMIDKSTLDKLAVVYLGQIFMLHIFELLDEAHVLAHAFIVFDEIFFEIHNVLVGWLFGSIDVDVAEIFIVGCLDEGD